MPGKISTHVLDNTRGCPASGVKIELFSVDAGVLLGTAITNADGRTEAPLLFGDDMAAGEYELVFHIGAAHPDLVGKAVLTAASSGEQASAGLTSLTPGEVAQFAQYNRAYRDKFGFPFVICARLNKKQAILEAFPQRLENSPETERGTALAEIYKIARLRLSDLLSA